MNVTVRGSFQVGRLLLSMSAKHLRIFLRNTGLEYEVTEDKGWPIGLVQFRLRGPKKRVDKIVNVLQLWIENESAPEAS